MTVLTREDIHYSASQTVDDLLRQVPWFSLFRPIGGCLGTPDNGELRFAAYARRKRLTGPEPFN